TLRVPPQFRSTGGPLTPDTRARASARRDLATAEELEHLTDRAFLARGFRQRQVVLYLVAIAPPIALFDHVTRVGEICHHTKGGALGDPERRRDVAEADARVARDAQQRPRMVREEAPLRHRTILVMHLWK